MSVGWILSRLDTFILADLDLAFLVETGTSPAVLARLLSTTALFSLFIAFIFCVNLLLSSAIDDLS